MTLENRMSSKRDGPLTKLRHQASLMKLESSRTAQKPIKSI